jgi:exodeoxyribonuclease VII large subunit
MKSHRRAEQVALVFGPPLPPEASPADRSVPVPPPAALSDASDFMEDEDQDLPVSFSGSPRPPILLDPEEPRGSTAPSKRQNGPSAISQPPGQGGQAPKSFAQALLGRRYRETALKASSDGARSELQQQDTPAGKSTASATQRGRLKESPPQVASERQVFTVRALVAQVRGALERAHPDVWIEGEISGFRAAGSGHVYFTLTDGDAQLPVVLFRNEARRLRFQPTDGLQVLVRGRVSVYDPRGQLQVIANTVEARGAGALQLAFEQMKARLKAEGLFDERRKRPLPAFPRTIGLITSLHGAVLRDILHVGLRRHPGLQLLVYPASMQGNDCSASVVRGLRWFQARREQLAAAGMPVDLLVLARGGGSAEDLCGFNDEALARAIAASELPVMSAIGHQTDFTIADFVADVRAPTPSAAAELFTASYFGVSQRLHTLDERLRRATQYRVLAARRRYADVAADRVLPRLHDGVQRRAQWLDDLAERASRALDKRQRAAWRRLESAETQLARQHPALRLARQQHGLIALEARLRRAPVDLLVERRRGVAQCAARLEAMSPVAVLSRGYALVYEVGGEFDGRLLRRAVESAPGASIRARLATGTILATVTEALPEGDDAVSGDFGAGVASSERFPSPK